MTLSQAIGKRILEIANNHNKSLKLLCELADVPTSSVKDLIYNKTTRPNCTLIYKICKSVDMSLSDFFNSNLFEKIS